MVLVALALIVLIGYLVTLKHNPSNIGLNFIGFQFKVKFKDQNKSGNA